MHNIVFLIESIVLIKLLFDLNIDLCSLSTKVDSHLEDDSSILF